MTTKEDFIKAQVEIAAKAAKEAAEKEWQAGANKREIVAFFEKRDITTKAKAIKAVEEAFGAAPKATGGKRTRTTITDDIRAKVKELAKTGKKAPTIAKELGLSVPTVYNILK